MEPERHALRAWVDVLVVHDIGDREVRFEPSVRVAEVWQARLERTEGLGHRRILLDGDVIEGVTRFVGAAREPERTLGP